MSKSVSRSIATAIVLLSVGQSSATAASGSKTDKASSAVAAKARQIVSGIHGTWQQMPNKITAWTMTPGALIGNGSVGVAIGGTPEKQQSSVGRNASCVEASCLSANCN